MNIPLKTVSSASFLVMKEEDDPDKVKPSTSSTPSKDKKISMSNLIKELAPFYTIYDVYFGALTREHAHGVGKGLSARVILISADPP